MEGALYAKEEILKAERFRDYRDLLSAVLKDDARYSTEEVELTILEYAERKTI